MICAEQWLSGYALAYCWIIRQKVSGSIPVGRRLEDPSSIASPIRFLMDDMSDCEEGKPEPAAGQEANPQTNTLRKRSSVTERRLQKAWREGE